MNNRDDRDGREEINKNDHLATRVEDLEKKVAYLEQQLLELQQGSPAAAQKPVSVSSGQTVVNKELVTPAAPNPFQAPAPQPKPPKPKTDWEHLIARVWLPRIFIAVLLIGVVWGFTAAVSAGIITEPVRCILGVVAAAFMYWQGEKQTRQSRHSLGQVLLGGSVAVLLLSLAAAHMLYVLIPAWLAFMLYVLTIGAGLWTALRHRSQALSVIMMLAGYLIPFLVDSAKPNIWTFTAYETVFSIAMILLAHRYAYRVAYYTAFFVLHVPLLIGSLIGDDPGSRYALMIAVLLQHALLFALSSFRWNRAQQANRPVSLFLSFGLVAAWMYGLFGNDDPYIYRLIVASCALVYSITAYWLVKQKNTATTHLAIATFGWFLWLVHVLEAEHLSTATVVEGTLAIILGITLKSKLQQITGALAYLFGMFCVWAQPIDAILSAETIAWLVLLASFAVLYEFLKRLPEGTADRHKRYKNSLLWIDSVLFLIFITQVTQVLTRSLSIDLQHLLLSAVWVLYAIGVIVTGVVTGKPKVRLAGILLLFVTLLKIIFADLPDVSTAVRAVLFIGLGIIGVAVSRLFYKRKD
ncbi:MULTISPECIES: DUF2339 domain-containing protein [unclassified Paenibacillus]|uniref:DUF2339 domain-containing protein n=1 Tax=unclassified Paenibacillus TaxID=185978 RepID=UPI003637EE9D